MQSLHVAHLAKADESQLWMAIKEGQNEVVDENTIEFNYNCNDGRGRWYLFKNAEILPPLLRVWMKRRRGWQRMGVYQFQLPIECHKVVAKRGKQHATNRTRRGIRVNNNTV